MENEEIRYLGDLQRLELKKGDLLVLRAKGYITDDTAARLKANMEHLPELQRLGVKVIVLADGLELGLLGAA